MTSVTTTPTEIEDRGAQQLARILAIDLEFVHDPLPDVEKQMNRHAVSISDLSFNWYPPRDSGTRRRLVDAKREAAIEIDLTNNNRGELGNQRFPPRESSFQEPIEQCTLDMRGCAPPVGFRCVRVHSRCRR